MCFHVDMARRSSGSSEELMMTSQTMVLRFGDGVEEGVQFFCCDANFEFRIYCTSWHFCSTGPMAVVGICLVVHRNVIFMDIEWVGFLTNAHIKRSKLK